MRTLGSAVHAMFRHAAAAAIAAAGLGLCAEDSPHPLIASIEQTVISRGGEAGNPTWFHPRACRIPGVDGQPATAFMTLQPIMGSDFFGPVHWMTSSDLGSTWTDPRPIPTLGRIKQPDGPEEGICDVVPDWHPATQTVLALGHNVFYSGERFSPDQPPRWPVYAVWRDGRWGPRRRLEWSDPRGSYLYSNGCGERVTLPGGDILLAFYFAEAKNQRRSVCGVRCAFDGETLTVRQIGETIEHAEGRGLMEPSLIRFGEKVFITLRAEDERAYVCVSDDGMKWSPKKAWAYDDGTPLVTSTTQQHWLAHSDALFLVYTRKDVSNTGLFRWRAPLWMAQVDPVNLRLIRATERVVLPIAGDAANDPKYTGLMGNFHVTAISPEETWITEGDIRPQVGYKGDLLLARIRWARPNTLVK